MPRLKTVYRSKMETPEMAFVTAESASLLPLSPLGRVVGYVLNHGHVDISWDYLEYIYPPRRLSMFEHDVVPTSEMVAANSIARCLNGVWEGFNLMQLYRGFRAKGLEPINPDAFLYKYNIGGKI